MNRNISTDEFMPHLKKGPRQISLVNV